MRHPRTAALAALAALLAAPASAQGLLDAICDDATERGETATETEYRADPGAHPICFSSRVSFCAAAIVANMAHVNAIRSIHQPRAMDEGGAFNRGSVTGVVPAGRL